MAAFSKDELGTEAHGFSNQMMDSRGTAQVECDVASLQDTLAWQRFSETVCSQLCVFVTMKFSRGNVKMARGERTDIQQVSSEPAN